MATAGTAGTGGTSVKKQNKMAQQHSEIEKLRDAYTAAAGNHSEPVGEVPLPSEANNTTAIPRKKTQNDNGFITLPLYPGEEGDWVTLPGAVETPPVTLFSGDASPVNTSSAPTTTTGYKPANANLDLESYWGDLHTAQNAYQNDPDLNTGYTYPGLIQQMESLGRDTSMAGIRSQQGGYTQNRDEAIAGGGTGDPAAFYKPGTWYYSPGIKREKPEGESGADEDHLDDLQYAYVQHCKQMYATAETKYKNATTPEEKQAAQEEMDYWHKEAEKTRAMSGYSGGFDGSRYYTLGQLGVYDDADGGDDEYGRGSGGNGGAGGASGIPGSGSNLNALLDAWQQAAMGHSNSKIDYAVAKAVADLERALADAQPQFKEQAESVDRNARQTMDNSALYAEMRGDKGGIGQEQYNSIQNTQAQNHLTVQQAQTKLATDTQRQIADLRAQGEFEKADAALQITQQYLQQLIGLEQWAAEYNLSVEQFNQSVRQWEAEYNMAMQPFQTGVNQWQAEFDAAQNQWQQQFDYGKKSDMANLGWALLEAGVPLSPEQMDAMDIDANQASQILMQAQLESALKGTKGTGDDKTPMDYTGLFEAAQASGHPQSFIANNYKKYGFTSSTGLYNDYKSWEEQLEEDQTLTAEEQTANYNTLKDHVNAWPSRGLTISNIAYMIESALKAGNISEAQAEELLDLIEQRVG